MDVGSILGMVGGGLQSYSSGNANTGLETLRRIQEQAKQAEQRSNESQRRGSVAAYAASRQAGPAPQQQSEQSPNLDYLRRARSQQAFDQAYGGLQQQLARLRSYGAGL